MTVSSGIYKGRTIFVPKSGVKPTSDRVRQAVMNMLSGDIRGAKFLDLCAGTGAVAIEALSHGASFACLVESTEKLYRVLKKNLEDIVPDRSLYRTVRHNAFQLTREIVGEDVLPFDIVFSDPFYDQIRLAMDDLYRVAMEMLRPGGIFMLEHGDKDDFSIWPGFVSARFYGDTGITVFRKAEA
jgi:16S rRNA (guanine(966)-N(2))-methyltransferase RsmD